MYARYVIVTFLYLCEGRGREVGVPLSLGTGVPTRVSAARRSVGPCHGRSASGLRRLVALTVDRPPRPSSHAAPLGHVYLAGYSRSIATTDPKFLCPMRQSILRSLLGILIAGSSVARCQGRVFDVTTFGAIGDGKADDTSAIRSAFAAAAATLPTST